MKANINIDLPLVRDLERVLEPLVSYICATDQPRAALASALAVLSIEVERTNRAATQHFGALAEHRSSL